jgi:hypothetical protein
MFLNTTYKTEQLKYTNALHKIMRHGRPTALYMMANCNFIDCQYIHDPKDLKTKHHNINGCFMATLQTSFYITAKMANQFGSVHNVCLVTFNE